MSAPTVSVVIPTRNRSALLARSVSSVLAQTYRDFELIVVDDASTDDTGEVLAGFKDERLRVLKRAKNSGAAAARNAGIGIARGKYLAFQDDDDFWLVEKLARQVAALEAAPAEVGLCLSGFISLTPGLTKYVGGQATLDRIDFRQGGGWGGPSYWLLSTPAWLVRRELLVGVGGFDERLRCADDWELALRLWKVSRFIQVDRPLFIQDWRRSHPGMAFNELSHANDLAIISDKHADLWRGRRRVQARHFYLVGKNFCFYKTPREGIPWLIRSLAQWPFQFRGWAALAVALLGKSAITRITAYSRTGKRVLRRALSLRFRA